jgi:hypothetical protein
LTKHDEALAQRVAAGGAVEVAVTGLAERDTEMQEAAAWLLGGIAGAVACK